MLTLYVPPREYFDERTETFINIPAQTLELEHSLYAVSKWEAKWHKAFLGKKPKTQEEMLDYIRCMTLTPNVDPMVYIGLTAENQEQIKEYLENRMSATYLSKREDEQKSGDTVTSELIFYWMTALQIPFECQHWHLNRLLMLIQVCSVKNQPQKKKGSRSIMRRNSALNAQRRAKHHTKG